MRPTFTVELEDSLELAARKLRENGCGVLPVTDGTVLAGGITEASLTEALANGKALTDPVSMIAKGVATAKPFTTGAEALRTFDQLGAVAIVVLDDAGQVLGVLTPSDLYPKRQAPPRPPLVGGMATPFGVYLTTGSLRAGVGHLALVATGMTLGSLLLGAAIITTLLVSNFVDWGIPARVAEIVNSALPFVLFLAGMRLLPLSGIHAAEHKVVHAIERGEELVPSTVRRMPRVHPRCGTNLAMGPSLFMGLGTMEVAIPSSLKILFAAIVTLLLWRPLGNAMQKYVTTRPPTEKHIAMGIRSGKELLNKYATSGTGMANPFQRIFNSGMLHVVTGSTLSGLLYYVIVKLFNLPDVLAAV